ncbi:MAG: helix-turn-helix transcriptional regulator [Oscillospiraceae bacterium]|nr:helix-turn-helix transcriptional regulator [Oscillospiraceae bacterium]
MKDIYDAQYRQLGLKISYYRRLRGLTQAELAERIDKAAAFIGQVESPKVKKTISLDTLFDIARVLNVAPKAFLDFDDTV